MSYRSLLTLCLLLALGSSTALAEQGKLILDESAYWHYYVQFGLDRLDPAALRFEGEQILGKTGMQVLKKRCKRNLTGSPAPVDWRDDARVWFSAGQGDSRAAARHSYSPPPPADWMKPGFRTTRWSRQRLPLMVGNFLRGANMHGDKDMQQLRVRRACFRTGFVVPDLARAGDLVLDVSFRGGARVFLNGDEIARAGLPRGDLKQNAVADPYPKQAYLCLEGEVPKYNWQKDLRYIGISYCEDLPGRFEDGAAIFTRNRKWTADERRQKWWSSRGTSRFSGYFGGWTTISRKGFDRITRLRNRTIGPLTFPKRLLRQGPNVLAVEVVAANIHPIVLFSKKGTRFRGGNWGEGFQRVMYWSHCRLLELRLRNVGGAVPAATARPAGVQVWVEDVHRRCYSPDFGQRGAVSGTVRFVGANNGTFGAQIVVGTDRELAGVRATPSELRGTGGAAIPASAVRVSYFVPHPADRLVKLGQIRNMVEDRKNPLCPPAEQAVIRFGGAEALRRRLPRERRLEILKRLSFFDHLGPLPPKRVLANTCRPIWLSLKVPADAAPGEYKGSVRVEAQGMEPVVLPVEARIIGWMVPSPAHFQTFMGLEQSPYGVARQYAVKLWSDKHFRLIDASFRQLARTGTDMVFIPVLQHMEFGNFDDVLIKWTRTKNGVLRFDYVILDRYLDVAIKHLGVPRVLCFCVMHGADRFGPGSKMNPTVPVLDQAAGKTEVLDLGSNVPGSRENWKAFVMALHAHLKARDLDRSLYWGFGWDGSADPQLIPLLAEFLPGVKWAKSCHSGYPRGAWGCVSNSLGSALTEKSAQGWKNHLIYMLCPRSGSTILSSNGHSPPFSYRVMMDRALVAGRNGLGRLGADYWADIYFAGYKGSLSGGIAGMPCSNLLYPGANGAESSARYEALLEGVQETEARIYIEQALDRSLLPGELAKRARDVLFRHNQETLFISPGRIGVQVHEYSSGWQARSRRLFEMAAEVARAAGFDVDRNKISVSLEARRKTRVPLTLRNWGVKERRWKAAADANWIALEQTGGRLLGQRTFHLTLDTTKLAPETAASGKVTVTDAGTGKTFPVEIAAKVGPVFRFYAPAAYDPLGKSGHAASWHPRQIGNWPTYNVTVGGSETRDFPLANLSGTELAWTINSPAPWIKAVPSSGKLAAGLRTSVKLIVTPPNKTAATRAPTLTVSEAGGSARQQVKLVVHVIPAYQMPALPKGDIVELKDVPKARVRSHKSRAYWYGSSSKTRADFGPRFGPITNLNINVPATTLSGGMAQETVYKLEGGGFAAFSATVRVNRRHRKPSLTGEHKARVNFEIHVDGKLVAQSGLMTPHDPARLLVVTGLKHAKRLRLFVRFDRPEASNHGRRVIIHWAEPRFYKAE